MKTRLLYSPISTFTVAFVLGIFGSCQIALNAAPSGTVAAWGNNGLGQTNVPLGLSNVVSIAGGSGFSLATTVDGRVVSWGSPNALPAGLTNIVAVAAGLNHSLALHADGTVTGWGEDSYGKASGAAALSNIRAISAGVWFSMGLRSNGQVVVWGQGDFGQTAIPPELTNAVAIAAGGHHCLALTPEGKVFAWGYNNSGERNVPTNVSNAIGIAAGYNHSMALLQNGSVVVWGGAPTPPADLSNVISMAAGYGFSLALKSDGTVVGWGENGAGQTNVPAGLAYVVAIAATWGGHSIALVDTSSLPPAPCIPRKAQATAQLVNGFVVGATITDGGCGYTNAPVVQIQGGGGNGATAIAVVTNGVVIRIIITDAGVGYDSPPRIVVASPPFVPSLSITVNRVRVVQSVVLARRYILESSRDGRSWNEAIAPFTATSEIITNEFDTDLTGRFFRVREVP